MTIFFNLPRNDRNPETQVDLILSNLSWLYDEDEKLCSNPGKHEFINAYFKWLYEDERTSGDDLAKIQHNGMQNLHGESLEGIFRTSKIGALTISCAYCCQALKAWYEGRVNEAWSYVCDAQFWSGLFLQTGKRLKKQMEVDHYKSVAETRSRIVEDDKQKKYYEKPLKFVNAMYNSRAWKDKAKATREISKALEDKIEKEGWPVEKVKCKETGESIPKEDWLGWVNRKLPDAKQVKIDARKFLEKEGLIKN